MNQSIRWICVQSREPWQKQDWYDEETLDYTRRGSKLKLLKDTQMSWKDAKSYGWKCIKVKVTIEAI